jgi:hypothetical protein
MIDFLGHNNKLKLLLDSGFNLLEHIKMSLRKSKFEHCLLLNAGTKISHNTVMDLSIAEPWSLVQFIKLILHAMYAGLIN